MVRLYLTVEGQTEQAFAVDVLQPHLAGFGVFVVKPRLTGLHGRRGDRIPRGGLLSTFGHAKRDIQRWLSEDQSAEARFSTMVDLYKLPRDFPGYADAMRSADPIVQAEVLEIALGEELADKRFVPYVQVHEFESLVLSEPQAFCSLFDNVQRRVEMLEKDIANYDSPELINHGQHSHPKARIRTFIEDYDENVDGPLLAAAIGLKTIREKCRHFDRWLTILERLNNQG